MKKLFVIAALVLAAAVSCTKEFATDEVISVEVTPEGYVPVTLCANIDLGTKAEIKDSKVVWEVGEEVAVFADGAGSALKFKVSACDEGDTSVAVKIQGDVPEGTKTFVAAYPYALATACKDNVVTINIKAEQSIPEGSTYDPSAFASVAYFANAESQPVFRNALSIVKFNVGNTEGVEAVRIYYKGDVQSAGPIEVNAETVAITNKCDNFTTITAKGGFVPGTTYTAVVAPASADGLKAVAIVGSKATSLRESGAESKLVLERNKGVFLGDVTANAEWKYYQIANAADLQGFLAFAPTYDDTDVVTVINDIDMNGVSLIEDAEGSGAAASSYTGKLDGGGFSIKNWDCNGVALFGTLTGEVTNLKIASSCQIYAVAPGAFGFVARELQGKVSNCESKATIKVNLGESMDPHYLGSLVGAVTSADALVSNCVNSGTVELAFAPSVTADNPMGVLVVGGLIGILNAECSNVLVKDCVNSGNITINGVNGAAEDTAVENLRNCFIGGVVGGTPANGTVKASDEDPEPVGFTSCYGVLNSCSNAGKIYVSWTGGTGGYFKVGGVIGYCEGALVSCENSGSVSFVNADEVMNAAPSVGGIAGIVAGKATVFTSNCVNNGAVYLSGMLTSSGNKYDVACAGSHMPTIGGCFGLIGDSVASVSDCQNKGVVSAKTNMLPVNATQNCFGGVFGQTKTCKVTNCINFAEMNVTATCRNMNFGGVVGYLGAGSELIGSGNQADLVANYYGKPLEIATGETKFNQYANIGGVVGYSQSGVVGISGCTNSGDITAKEASASLRVGGIVAMSYNDVSGCINSGDLEVSHCVYEDNTKFKLPSYVGGVIGCPNIENQKITSCSNSGKVTFTCDGGGGTIAIGGVIGYSSKEGSEFSKLENTGKVYVNCQNFDYPQVGGIIGHIYSVSSVISCVNSGNVVTESTGGLPRVAGICGYLAKGATGVPDNLLFQNCTNNGDITFNSTEAPVTASSYVYVGGITGSEQKSNNVDGAVVIADHCVNNGAVKVLAPTELGYQVRAGGIAAHMDAVGAKYTFKLLDCTNNGEVYSSSTVSQIGGILALTGGASSTMIVVERCVNNAKLSAEGGQIGGIIGKGGHKKSTFTDVVITKNTVIEVKEAEGAIVGLIGGNNSAFTTAVTGKVAGSVIVGSETVVIDADNYKNYLFGVALGSGSSVDGVVYQE